MALVDTTWYTNAGDQSTTGYYAVALRPQNTAVAAGVLRRQFTAPAVGNERVFVCIIAGTTGNVTDATWVLTRGAKTTDGTVTWMECTGQAGLNGDLTNTATWAQVKAVTPAVLGQVIKRSNNASYQICTTAGAMSASEPAFSDTAGVTTTDTTAVWTSLGVVGNFTGGQAPHARLNNMFGSNWFVAGNTVYVGDNHAESQATAISFAPSGGGTAAIISRIICHNHTGSYPPGSGDLATSATISSTSTSVLSINPQGSMYFYGLTFKSGVGTSTTGVMIAISGGNWSDTLYFDKCSMQILATGGGGAQIQLGNSGPTGSAYIFNNTTIYFGATADYISILSTRFIWQGTGQILASGSSIPATLFSVTNAFAGVFDVLLEALDLSQLTGNLCTTPNSSVIAKANFLVKDCKLNASMTFATPAFPGVILQYVRSDSAATGYKSARYQYEGTETTESSITRVGGAADPSGQAQSRKIVTTANSQWLMPFKAEPYAIWNAVTGANVTVTVYGVISGVTLPNNDEIWLEVEYLGSSATPLGTIVTTTKSNVLSANAAVASDSSSWNNASNTAAVLATLDGTATNVTMSNGNKTATHSQSYSGSGDGVRSVIIKSSGKFYFEFTCGATHGQSDSPGILLSTGTYADQYAGNNCVMVLPYWNVIYANNANSGLTIGNVVAADIVSFAVDLDNRRCWLRRNGGNWNGQVIGSQNPATNTGGVTVAAGAFSPSVVYAGPSSVSGDNFTINCGQSSFAYTPPSGFGNWQIDAVNYTLFKLTTTLSSPQPGMAGYIHVRVRAAKVSTTYYVDPMVVLS